MEKIINKIKNVSRPVWILILIVLLGIFLRTYNFHDWLRFSMDQSRDAILISNVVKGKSPLPLLGPLAGGTNFYLGPAYYYFSIFSAKIFGNYPDKMAYPSLFFSILAIPLLFLFVKEYFSVKISLILTVVMSVSYFAIANSRFSSNPNLAPFFVLAFLYTFFKLMNGKNKDYFWCSILLGISLGIGVQIHTILLVIMPTVTVILLAYLIKKRGKTFIKSLLFVVVMALAMNVTQIINEFRTQGSNTKNFIVGLQEKGDTNNNLGKNIWRVTSCQVRANAHIISSSVVMKKCSENDSFKVEARKLYKNIKNKNLRKFTFATNLFLAFLFSLGGYFLLGYYFLKEKEEKKRNFLRIIIVFNVIAFISFIPIINSMHINYFIILLFIPFVLLGLWLKFFSEKFGNWGKGSILIIVIILIACSLNADKQAYNFYNKGLDNNQNNSDLKEIENIALFMLKKEPFKEIIYFSGRKKYINRFSRPLFYLVQKNNKKMIAVDINDIKKVQFKGSFFYIQKGGAGNIERNKIINGYKAIAGEKFNEIEIYELWKK